MLSVADYDFAYRSGHVQASCGVLAAAASPDSISSNRRPRIIHLWLCMLAHLTRWPMRQPQAAVIIGICRPWPAASARRSRPVADPAHELMRRQERFDADAHRVYLALTRTVRTCRRQPIGAVIHWQERYSYRHDNKIVMTIIANPRPTVPRIKLRWACGDLQPSMTIAMASSFGRV